LALVAETAACAEAGRAKESASAITTLPIMGKGYGEIESALSDNTWQSVGIFSVRMRA
jgi:hypothetical protein